MDDESRLSGKWPPTVAALNGSDGEASVDAWVVVAPLHSHRSQSPTPTAPRLQARARAVAHQVTGPQATFLLNEEDLSNGLTSALQSLLADRTSKLPEAIAVLDPAFPFVEASDLVQIITALVDQRARVALVAVAPGPDPDDHEQLIDSSMAYALRPDDVDHADHLGDHTLSHAAIHRVPRWRALSVDDLVAIDQARIDQTWHPDDGAERLPPRVDAVVFDFDGVMTDDRVLVMEDGREGVMANRSDGMGIEHLRATGIALAVLSKEANPVVKARCAKLGIECIQGIDEKWPVLRHWLDERGLAPEHLVFLGNDVNDVECLRAAGCGVVVADAHPRAAAVADLVLSRNGGAGAVRELADMLLDTRVIGAATPQSGGPP